jgi:hypothetical protein
LSAGSANNLPFGVNPLLGPLADNGGPTRTHALLPASPLIDAGGTALVPADATFDQRGAGFPRVLGRAVDIGAFEAVAPPPRTRVQQVFVNGAGLTGQTSANGVAFRSRAGIDNVYGYPVPAGAAQTKSVPWGNGINKIAIRFDTDVAGRLEPGDLAVRGINSPAYAVSALTYDAATRTGVWTLANAIVNDKVRLYLDDALLPGLDGEWQNGVATQSFPSGDGTAGGDFSFRINVLPGDANQDGSVNAQDLGIIKLKLNRNAINPGSGTSGYSVFADLNADGAINALDLGSAKQRLNKKLPPGEPA